MEQRKTTERFPLGRLVLVGLGAVAFTLILGMGRADAVMIVDQESSVTNSGAAVANSGGNEAEGNASDNDVNSNQNANAGNAGGDSVAVNTSSTSNSSDGSASIHTGDATAVGNNSATTQSQAVHTGGDQPSIVLVDQESDVDNAGLGIANTGFNGAVGNTSNNTSDIDQTANAGNAGDDSVAVNTAVGSNNSTGTAIIHTGNATAIGNLSATTVCQGVNATPVCPRAVLQTFPGNTPAGQTPPAPAPLAPAPTAPGLVTTPVQAERSRIIGTGGIGGDTLARTGSSVAGLAFVGGLLVVLGAVARRRAVVS